MSQFLSALSNPAVISVVAMVLELVLHAIPSEKPLGLLHGASKIMHLIADVAAGVGAFLDKILPQALK